MAVGSVNTPALRKSSRKWLIWPSSASIVCLMAILSQLCWAGFYSLHEHSDALAEQHHVDAHTHAGHGPDDQHGGGNERHDGEQRSHHDHANCGVCQSIANAHQSLDVSAAGAFIHLEPSAWTPVVYAAPPAADVDLLSTAPRGPPALA